MKNELLEKDNIIKALISLNERSSMLFKKVFEYHELGIVYKAQYLEIDKLNKLAKEEIND